MIVSLVSGWALLAGQPQMPPDFDEAAGFETPPVELTNPLPVDDLPSLIGMIIRAVLGLVGSVALLVFVYGGLVWLVSQGNPALIRQGQQTLAWATVGLAVVFMAYALVRFVLGKMLGLT